MNIDRTVQKDRDNKKRKKSIKRLCIMLGTLEFTVIVMGILTILGKLNMSTIVFIIFTLALAGLIVVSGIAINADQINA